MNICLLNKFYLPDKSITAQSAAELVKYLQLSGHSVQTVSTFSSYTNDKVEYGISDINHKIKAVYNGKNKILRLLGSCLESMALVSKALSLDADIYIVMTSPPLLNYFAGRRFKANNKDWIYWSLDLYPEAFKANGLVSESNKLYNYILKAFYQYKPDYLLTLGNHQKDYLQESFGSKIPSSLMPCGAFVWKEKKGTPQVKQPVWKKADDKIYFAYIGNLGEAHSLDFLKRFLDALDNSRHKLILALYGSKANEMLTYVKANPAVEIVEYIKPSEFGFIDVHLASLLPEWVNVCVPSKLVSAVCNGASFLFYGPEKSDSWQYLNDAGWLINCHYTMEMQIQKFLEELDLDKIHSKKEKALALGEKIEKELLKGYKKLDNFLIEKVDKPIV